MTEPTDSRGDEGFTLIELIIASMILVLVLGLVGAMLGSMASTSKTVNTLSASTTSAQLAAESIEHGVRNSSDFLLTNPTGTDQLLVARIAQGGSTLVWQCIAWYYSASNGSIRTTTSSGAIAAPTSTALSHWTLLTTGVSPSSGTGIFSDAAPQLKIAFKDQTPGGGPVVISSTAVSRAGSSGTPACY